MTVVGCSFAFDALHQPDCSYLLLKMSSLAQQNFKLDGVLSDGILEGGSAAEA